MKKMRLDALLVENGFVESRNKAQALIMAGKVRVNGQVVTKAGTPTNLEAALHIENDLPYVSRGGLKLIAALEAFAIEVSGKVCADVGASTGGFTDVLLQRGAARVYAIDVGYGQLAWKLRQDERVIVMERTNARHLATLPETVEVVTIDASFISLKLLLPVVFNWLAAPGFVIALVKPQFEAGKNQVSKGGVVRDRAIHYQVLEKTIDYAVAANFSLLGLINSPITGPAGNHEFLLYLGGKSVWPTISAPEIIDKCLANLDR